MKAKTLIEAHAKAARLGEYCRCVADDLGARGMSKRADEWRAIADKRERQTIRFGVSIWFRLTKGEE